MQEIKAFRDFRLPLRFIRSTTLTRAVCTPLHLIRWILFDFDLRQEINFEWKFRTNIPKKLPQVYYIVYHDITFRPSVNSQGDSYKQSFWSLHTFYIFSENVYQQNQNVFVCLFNDCLEDELCYSNVKYSTTLLIRTLVIRVADYPVRLGPSGKFVDNSTKPTGLAITVYQIKYSTVLGLLELQIRCGRKV